MHRVFHLVFLLCATFLSLQVIAAETPVLIRIRTLTDLPTFPEVSQAQLKKISPRIWSLNGESLEVEGKPLSTNNLIHQKSNGKFDVISLIEFNEYLAGVVTGEMPSSWPLEALKAQAVVARSYALSKIAERQDQIYHLESDHLDQVYRAQSSKKARAAVLATDGVVLKKRSGGILKAYYHADCGGHTVDASSVWGSGEYNSGTAKDPWCASRHSHRWSHEMDLAEFSRKLQIKEQEIAVRSYFAPQSQVVKIGSLVISIQRLREMFGFFNLRSSISKIELNEDTSDKSSIKISGQGFGHGAGLCQWGTRDQVRAGRTYLQVLKHYYPRAKIERNQTYLSFVKSVETVSN